MAGPSSNNFGGFSKMASVRPRRAARTSCRRLFDEGFGFNPLGLYARTAIASISVSQSEEEDDSPESSDSLAALRTSSVSHSAPEAPNTAFCG